MQKYTLFFLTLTILIFPSISIAKEHIIKFNSDITLNHDSSINIIETIKYDFSVQDKHGIYRTIPIKYKTDIGTNRSIKISDISVTDEMGKEYNFTKSKSGKNLKIKIGDANKTITGIHTYEISYTVLDAINYFNDYDEFYWNITGNDWNLPIDSITSMIHSSGIQKIECYKGIENSKETCDKKTFNKTYANFLDSNLSLNEGMTIVVGVSKGIIKEKNFIEKIWSFLLDNSFKLLLPIIVIIGLFTHWWRFGRDPKNNKSIIPMWEIPDNLRPGELGIIIDETFDSEDFSSIIIDLAVRGYITIKQINTKILFLKSSDYELTLLKNNSSIYSDNSLEQYEQDFLMAFFGNQKKVLISSKKQKFSREYKKLTSQVYKKITGNYFIKNPEKVASNYVIFGIIFIISLNIIGGMTDNFILILIGWIGGMFIIIGYGKLMIKRTKKGSDIKYQIEGLRMYLKTAEKRKLDLLNTPKKNAEHFEKMLPYAIALGVTKEWGEQFDDLIQKEPEWYNGGTNNFNAASFGSAMQGFSTSTSTGLSSTTSASSGGSGFSGGGSGGGFGGGGGGSW